MDSGEKEEFMLEKRGADSLYCNTTGLATTEWNQIGYCPCPSASLVDAYSYGHWNLPVNAHSLGFTDAQAAAATSSAIGKPFPLNWNPSDSLTKEMLPLGVSYFPSDTGFIERAARFSCFSSQANPFISHVSNAIAGAQMPKNERSLMIDDSSNVGSPVKEQMVKGHNEFPEAKFSSEVAFEEQPNSSKVGFHTNKRKRNNQDTESDQGPAAAQLHSDAAKEATDNNLKAEQSSSIMATVKPSGNSRESGEAPKEDYIHVRARRGQATNSHSLAERVRREKISERMKFLQDLVPGCSKVTGKAVMLDEIINYVQSLQRQVEFLSMKLAAVNPRMDFNIEGLLTKDLFQNRSGGSSSAIMFSPDMIHHQLHPPHQALIQVGMPGVINPSDAFGSSPNVQLTSTSSYKEAAHQIHNAWDEDFHNVVQMTYGNNPPVKTQDLNGTPRDGFSL